MLTTENDKRNARITAPPLYRIAAIMRILVRGAAGYIGSALGRALGAANVLATDQGAMSFPNAVVGNIAYPQFARSLITPEIDAACHLASRVSGGARQEFALGTE